LTEGSKGGVKVSVDASVFTSDASIGSMTGDLYLPIVPQIGDQLSLWLSNKNGNLEKLGCSHFLLTVENRTILISDNQNTVAISLSDIIVESFEKARILAEILNKDYGLWLDIYNDN
jgi:hypothetical protein